VADELDVIRLLALRDTPVSVDEVLAAASIRRPAGSRCSSAPYGITTAAACGPARLLGPSERRRCSVVAGKVVSDFPVVALVAVHQVGDLAIGDLAVVVAVACPHRAEAFAACRRIDDEGIGTDLETQLFADGPTSGLARSDRRRTGCVRECMGALAWW
jgi:molybdopterin synthase catalytic subunit